MITPNFKALSRRLQQMNGHALGDSRLPIYESKTHRWISVAGRWQHQMFIGCGASSKDPWMNLGAPQLDRPVKKKPAKDARQDMLDIIAQASS